MTTFTPGSPDLSPTFQRTQGERPGLRYARTAHALILDWYKSAELKAQALLTLDGVIIGFLANSLFGKPAEVREFARLLDPKTLVMLGLMAVALTGSVISSLLCLRSRLYSRRSLAERMNGETKFDNDTATPYTAGAIGFFQFVACLKTPRLLTTLDQATDQTELEVLSDQLIKLSANVTRKHRYINVGFALTAASLVLLLLAGASYAARARNSSAPSREDSTSSSRTR